MPTDSGNYYLTQDITLTSAWSAKSGVTNICLNGFIIKQGMAGQRVITVPTGGTLNIYDCPNGKYYLFTKITDGDSAGLWTIDEKGTERIDGGIITGGKAGDGAGVRVNGVFTLYGGTIAGNYAGYTRESMTSAGGVFVSDGGQFTLNGGKISGNLVYGQGGGVGLNYRGGAQFTMISGEISNNTAETNGGGVKISSVPKDGVNKQSTFSMEGGTIKDNIARNNNGGGVMIDGSGGAQFIMNGGTISDNEATKDGGGIYVNTDTTFTMADGTISDNEAKRDGGGVYVKGTLTMKDEAEISGNTANGNGGGVYANNAVTMEWNAEISGNTANGNGGGVYIPNTGSLTMNGNAVISYNRADGSTANTGHGGGVYVTGGTFAPLGGSISYNTATSSVKGGGYGGGVYLNGVVSGVTMKDMVISHNEAITAGGIGVYKGSKLTITSDTKIQENKAKGGSSTDVRGSGGGVLVSDQGSGFTMETTTQILNNVAGDAARGQTMDNGGGVHVGGGTTFTMNGGEITGNRAYNGAGVYIDGIATMVSGTIQNNIARNDGGGVQIADEAQFTMETGTISGNEAHSADYPGDNIVGGAGVYVGKTSSFVMKAGTISSNWAQNCNGGGVYANAAGQFTIYDGVIISENTNGNEKTDSTVLSNVFLRKNTYQNVERTPYITIADKVESTPDITIRTTETPTYNYPRIIAEGGSSDYSAKFISEDENYIVIHKEEESVHKLYLIPKYYTITLEMDGGSDTVTATYGASKITGYSKPTKTSYTLDGWYAGDKLVLDSTGDLKKGVDGYTDADGNWICGDATLTAAWTLNSYHIFVTADPRGGGSVTGEGDYNHGDSVTLEATANTGYQFVNWTKGGTQVATTETLQFTAEETATYVANFEKIAYTISATANPSAGGTISGTGNYAYGDLATLIATANPGYQFVNWTKGGTQVATTETLQFTAEETATYVANFEKIAYTISATANPSVGGTTRGAGNYAHGYLATLIATANPGYQFVNWTEGTNEKSTEASYTFPVTSDRALTANFVALPPTPADHTITVTTNPSVGGTVMGGGTYQEGTIVTVTATTNPGYQFVNWTEGTTEVSTEASYTFPVTSDRALTANFVVLPPTPGTLIILDDGSGNPKTVNVPYGSDSHILNGYTPTREGYVFDGWHTEDGTLLTDKNGNLLPNVPGYTDADGNWINPSLRVRFVAHWTEIPHADPPKGTSVWLTEIPTIPPTETPTPDDDDPVITPGEDTGKDNLLWHIISMILIKLLIVLFLILLFLRKTVTFIVHTPTGVEKYKVKCWYGKCVNQNKLPELLRNAVWYRDAEQTEIFELDRERIRKSIEVYLS